MFSFLGVDCIGDMEGEESESLFTFMYLNWTGISIPSDDVKESVGDRGECVTAVSLYSESDK